MRERKGVVIVSFDLPTETSDDKSNYRKFRAFLIKNGYVLFQASVYYKIIKNTLNSHNEIRKVSVNSPDKGNIVAIPLTINEVSKLQTIRGKEMDLESFTDEVFFFESA